MSGILPNAEKILLLMYQQGVGEAQLKQRAGVHYNTTRKVFGEPTQAVRRDALDRIARALGEMSYRSLVQTDEGAAFATEPRHLSRDQPYPGEAQRPKAFEGRYSGGMFAADFSPDGKQLVCLRSRGAKQRYLYIVRAVVGTRKPRRGVTKAKVNLQSARNVAWAPRRKLIALCDAQGDSYIYDLKKTRHALWKTPCMQGEYADALAWSPDAEMLAVGGGSGVQLLHRKTGQVETLGREFVDIYALAFSPNGRRLAIGGEDTVVHVHVYDCVEREVVNRITRIEQHIASVDWSSDGEQLLVGGMVRRGLHLLAGEALSLVRSADRKRASVRALVPLWYEDSFAGDQRRAAAVLARRESLP